MHLSLHIKKSMGSSPLVSTLFISMLFCFSGRAADAIPPETAAGFSAFFFQPPSHLFSLAQTVPLPDQKWLTNLILLLMLIGSIRFAFPKRTPSLEESFEKKGSVEKLRTEFKDDLNDRFKGMSSKVQGVKDELVGDISLLRTEISQRDNAVQKNYETLIGAVGRIEGRLMKRTKPNV